MFLGPDFREARRSWLYAPPVRQTLLVALALFVLLVVLNSVGQLVGGSLTYLLLGGSFNTMFDGKQQFAELFAKATVVGLLPASLVVAYFAYFLAGLGGRNAKDVLSLRMPQLGVVGWLVTLVGFLAIVYLINVLVFTVTGIDPQNYVPTQDANNPNSSGLVEKTMADLANEPLLFAIAFPGVALAVPLVEELIFRGALFSAIAASPVGRAGAVVLSAAAWALLHATGAPWLFVGLIFLMGLVLGLLLLRFGSLWVTIACHGVWNALTSLSIFGLSGGG